MGRIGIVCGELFTWWEKADITVWSRTDQTDNGYIFQVGRQSQNTHEGLFFFERESVVGPTFSSINILSRHALKGGRGHEPGFPGCWKLPKEIHHRLPNILSLETVLDAQSRVLRGVSIPRPTFEIRKGGGLPFASRNFVILAIGEDQPTNILEAASALEVLKDRLPRVQAPETQRFTDVDEIEERAGILFAHIFNNFLEYFWGEYLEGHIRVSSGERGWESRGKSRGCGHVH
ncbi:hypothetical protein N7492_005229 [Penicillium capsulatum]|uniref:Uncharacterized protein n=1 Tax=Penicillium capsulatum TaxID=69766 RepID=A0A9W9IBW1_9EURO|nr:hypothetical protein N7492_005229 [Penicillium capsulatum]